MQGNPRQDPAQQPRDPEETPIKDPSPNPKDPSIKPSIDPERKKEILREEC